MTILERIKQDLAHLDEQQLQQVAELITKLKRSQRITSGSMPT